MKRPVLAALALTLVPALLPSPAHAFCGFYVSGAEGSLYANATMVVLMRNGTRTVLSMQNNYAGPPQDFAMVVPVPAVLHEEDVHTLPREIFARIDSLAAPRLVEYWEGDPCAPVYDYESVAMAMPSEAPSAVEEESGADLGVRVEASFSVGEYDIVILSAEDSGGLETWLHREHYNIPSGAGEVLRPYVENGTKFFVARVDVSRVNFVNGRALLSPLRVQYDAPELMLPVRLGLLNSDGTQDLIVHVLAQNERYEVANYENAFIPTNLRVTNAVRDEFGGFYEYLFRETIEGHPRAVVTEYAWSADTCDPCPTEPLNPNELMTLGADVMPGSPTYGWVLTRLHYRYTRDTLGDDLVFRAAPGMTGGTGIPAPDGTMTTGATASGYGSMFQGRYVILHPWEGPIECASPNRGSWGGPPGGYTPPPLAANNVALTSGIPAASSNATDMLVDDVPEIGVTGTATTTGRVVDGTGRRISGGGCASCAAQPASALLPALALTSLVFALFRRRG